MTDKQETLADIVAEMRKKADELMEYTGWWYERPTPAEACLLRSLADRIDAAAKRETVTQYANIDGRRVAVLHGRVAKTPDGRIHEVVTPATHNAAKLREAVAEIRNRLVYLYGRTDGTFYPPALQEVCEIAEDALSAPPRNCDAGTLEEQEERFDAYCTKIKTCERCRDCMNGYGAVHERCVIEWEQAPYEAPAAQKGGE